ncbi:MAG: GNAT family N-acetyltransferase [Ignavibacteria bacterium]|jgi:ElaA protein
MKEGWNCLAFDELTGNDVYEILKLREAVFILEQQCLYIDIDNVDKTSLHITFIKEDKLLAYARIIPGNSPDHVIIGRIIVNESVRGTGLGKELVHTAIAQAQIHYSPIKIDISAQDYLRRFYESFGFIIHGTIYDLDGIPHIDMSLQLV